MEKPVDRLECLSTTIQEANIRTARESEMQTDVQEVLESLFEDVSREHRFDGRDRVDFFVDGIAIECKVNGTWTKVFEQLQRYASHDEVKSVVLITSRRKSIPPVDRVGGKPLLSIWVTGIGL